jgi:hypothetical protein
MDAELTDELLSYPTDLFTLLGRPELAAARVILDRLVPGLTLNPKNAPKPTLDPKNASKPTPGTLPQKQQNSGSAQQDRGEQSSNLFDLFTRIGWPGFEASRIALDGLAPEPTLNPKNSPKPTLGALPQKQQNSGGAQQDRVEQLSNLADLFTRIWRPGFEAARITLDRLAPGTTLDPKNATKPTLGALPQKEENSGSAQQDRIEQLSNLADLFTRIVRPGFEAARITLDRLAPGLTLNPKNASKPTLDPENSPEPTLGALLRKQQTSGSAQQDRGDNVTVTQKPLNQPLPLKLNPKLARQIAEYPSLLYAAVNGPDDPVVGEFVKKLEGMTFEHIDPEKIAAMKAAEKERKFKAWADAEDKLADRYWDYRSEAGRTVYGGRGESPEDFAYRNIKMRPLPEALMEGRPIKPLGYTQADVERAIKLQKAPLLDEQQAALAADAEAKAKAERESRLRHLAGIEPSPSLPKETFGKYKQGEYLPSGSRVDYAGPDTISIVGPALLTTPERDAYLAKLAQQMGRDKPYATLDEFKADQAKRLAENEQNRKRIEAIKDIARRDAIAGRAPAENATEEYMKIYDTLTEARRRRGLPTAILGDPIYGGGSSVPAGLTPDETNSLFMALRFARTPEQAAAIRSAALDVANMRSNFLARQQDNAFKEKELGLREKDQWLQRVHLAEKAELAAIDRRNAFETKANQLSQDGQPATVIQGYRARAAEELRAAEEARKAKERLLGMLEAPVEKEKPKPGNSRPLPEALLNPIQLTEVKKPQPVFDENTKKMMAENQSLREQLLRRRDELIKIIKEKKSSLRNILGTREIPEQTELNTINSQLKNLAVPVPAVTPEF